MFNTVIQPTGIYGTYPGLTVNPNNNGSSTSVTDPLGPAKKTKPTGKTVALRGLAVAAVAVAVIWGLPALRTKHYGGDRLFQDIFLKPSKKFPVLDPFRKAFVRTADFLDERIKTPTKIFLRENLLKFKHHS